MKRDGLGIQEAAAEAARLRFRAVCMTALSFVLGILPLVLASGAGMFSQLSLGHTVFLGHAGCTAGRDTVYPGLYSIVQSIRERIKGQTVAVAVNVITMRKMS